jgi:hypothetical protein
MVFVPTEVVAIRKNYRKTPTLALGRALQICAGYRYTRDGPARAGF